VQPPNPNHRWFAGACAALNADRGFAGGRGFASDTEREFPLATQAGMKRPASNPLGGKAAEQRTVDGKAASKKTYRRRQKQRVPLTLWDKYTIVTFAQAHPGMSHQQVADWCGIEGNLVGAKKPEKSTISKLRKYTDDIIRKCVPTSGNLLYRHRFKTAGADDGSRLPHGGTGTTSPRTTCVRGATNARRWWRT
jgi:hypothetical protein